MKKILIIIGIITTVLNGCATNSKIENSGVAAVACGILGGLIGFAVGGGEEVAIGAGVGAIACGVTTYAFADDFSKAVVEENAIWQNSVMGVQHQKPTKKSDAFSKKQKGKSGKTILKIKKDTMLVPTRTMILENHLSPVVANNLSKTHYKIQKTGGRVLVKCPTNTTNKIMNEIRRTGVTCERSKAIKNGGYAVVLSKVTGKRYRA